MFKLDLEKAEESKMKGFCFIDYTKAFDYVNHHKLRKILKEIEIPDHLTCLLKNPYADQEATARTRRGATDWIGSKLGKEYDKAAYRHPAHLTSMQRTSGKMLD